MIYDHKFVCNEIKKFECAFTIGRSRMNREIYCIPVGNGPVNTVFAAAFHGLEFLTAAALLCFAEKYYNMKKYHSRFRVYFIPMVNPDGVDIAVNGIDPKIKNHQTILSHTGIIDFKHKWQANALGVDINHNFDANWEPILFGPSPSRYGGKYPVSEPETRAVVDFLDRVKPELFIAFHSQGKEIYYDFNGMENKRSEETARRIAEKVGYTVSVPTGTASFGGAKDWYIKTYQRMAFTAELGKGVNPLPEDQLPEMSNDVEQICLTAMQEII